MVSDLVPWCCSIQGHIFLLPSPSSSPPTILIPNPNPFFYYPSTIQKQQKVAEKHLFINIYLDPPSSDENCNFCNFSSTIGNQEQQLCSQKQIFQHYINSLLAADMLMLLPQAPKTFPLKTSIDAHLQNY